MQALSPVEAIGVDDGRPPGPPRRPGRAMARLGAAGEPGRLPHQHRAGPGRRGRGAAQRGAGAHRARAAGRGARPVPARRPRAGAAPSAQPRPDGRVLRPAPVAERWTARFTSSRTLVFPGRDSGDALFSLKLATDHPHPDFRQPEKTKLREEAIDAVGWAWVLARIDAAARPDRGRRAACREVMIVLVAGRESGFLVRDLRLFQDGHYYLPALSLPFVGGADRASCTARASRAFWGQPLRRAGRAREGAPARALRALVRDAESAEPARAARPRPAPDREARVPRRRRRRLRHRRARGARRAVAAARRATCGPRRAPRSGRSTRRASTRSRPTCSSAGTRATTPPTTPSSRAGSRRSRRRPSAARDRRARALEPGAAQRRGPGARGARVRGAAHASRAGA